MIDPPAAVEEDSLFDKIVRGAIPSSKVYEDDLVFAFRDISPQAPVHIVLVPKNRQGLTGLRKADESHKALLGHLMWAAAEIARRESLDEGWRLVVNDGPSAGQTVFHLHLHILGGREFGWPPG
mmetsp:Transcript_29273/g.52353  ORF Transcript_29273/g.52353 Transcript_29273/m.52353 type:complete len:124 (-) Transcript_29273:2365-2736(-)|eukprot:CAMPEP_0204917048 /NCGR_PEP_ID=MMETSP1397-20131031/14736_1 /ASSEMBLY_ACC=CAM_ASM_000891 /TAXON_ID=49980 /ORGANISM="Climacostomum Climacostomum virens, Strain Stock W-24" /LENGTH=123 /DNA_ID=CAMNT_0052089781 /DNA_START=45 /DNA_END=416 /DNA_ORIENTATION=+